MTRWVDELDALSKIKNKAGKDKQRYETLLLEHAKEMVHVVKNWAKLERDIEAVKAGYDVIKKENENLLYLLRVNKNRIYPATKTRASYTGCVECGMSVDGDCMASCELAKAIR